jgi:hypothetical protein
MIGSILGLIITLCVYWVLWKIYLSVAESFFPNCEYRFIVKPNFWQFAFSLFIIMFVYRKLK